MAPYFVEMNPYRSLPTVTCSLLQEHVTVGERGFQLEIADQTSQYAQVIHMARIKELKYLHRTSNIQ